MHVGEKLKSAFEAAHQAIETEEKKLQKDVATVKSVLREIPRTLGHVDYTKLALKPTQTIGAPAGVRAAKATVRAVKAAIHGAEKEITRDARGAVATVKDPKVEASVGAAITASVPFVKSAGATAYAGSLVVRDVPRMADALDTVLGGTVTGQPEIALPAAVDLVLTTAQTIGDSVKLVRAESKAARDLHAAAPVIRGAAHEIVDTFKKSTGR